MNRRPRLARAMGALALAALVAGCNAQVPAPGVETIRVAAAASAGSGSGGSITNTPSVFLMFTATPTTVLNDGTGSVLFSITLKDNNSEADITDLHIFVNGSTLASDHHVKNKEVRDTTEPASFGTDGWKAWGGAANDGILYAKYQETIFIGTPAGTYLTGVSSTDASGRLNYPPSSMQIPIVVRAPSVVAAAASPVNWTGVSQTGASWGAWSAEPGERNVNATNYLEITNTGAYPTPTVVVDFSNATFRGATDATVLVPIDGNVQFATWEDTTPLTTAPNEGTYAWLPASSEGSVTFAFHATGNVIYVAYRVVALPSVLTAQSYVASYTVTDITP